MNRQFLMVAGLWVAVLASAMSVIYVSHRCRTLNADLADLRREFFAQEVEWGKLMLEQASLASLGLVERKAKRDLNMHTPTVDDVVVVRP